MNRLDAIRIGSGVCAIAALLASTPAWAQQSTNRTLFGTGATGGSAVGQARGTSSLFSGSTAGRTGAAATRAGTAERIGDKAR